MSVFRQLKNSFFGVFIYLWIKLVEEKRRWRRFPFLRKTDKSKIVIKKGWEEEEGEENFVNSL